MSQGPAGIGVPCTVPLPEPRLRYTSGSWEALGRAWGALSSGHLWDSGSFPQHLFRIPAQDLSISWTPKLLDLAVAVPLPTPCKAGARFEVSMGCGGNRCVRWEPVCVVGTGLSWSWRPSSSRTIGALRSSVFAGIKPEFQMKDHYCSPAAMS